MSTDIRISELNEVNTNKLINHVVINARENINDVGITKKILVSNFLPVNGVEEKNITAGSVTNIKLGENSVDDRVINNACNFTFANITINDANLSGNIAVAGTVDGRNVSVDGTYLDSLSTTVIPALSSSIDNVNISLASLDLQTVTTTGSTTNRSLSVAALSAFGKIIGGTGVGNTANGANAAVLGGFRNTANGNNSTIAGGISGLASGLESTIGGGRCNTALSARSTVSGGYGNLTSGTGSTIGGGFTNVSSCDNTTVAGGACNISCCIGSTVGGGGFNISSGDHTIVAGGFCNTSSGVFFSTVGGGGHNTASGSSSTIAGGLSGLACGLDSTIGGGRQNTASNFRATVGGGCCNTASGVNSTIAGGANNTALSARSTIGGGCLNTASGSESTIGGGRRHIADGNDSTIAGGVSGLASGDRATIGGGANNTACGNNSTIGGGCFNTASGSSSTIAGGLSGLACGLESTIAGGRQNTALSARSTIGGGLCNTANSCGSTIGGGRNNLTEGEWATIGGGRYNTTNCNWTTIGGGRENKACNIGSTIAGGISGLASGQCATIGGGRENTASGRRSGILGGQKNTVTHTDSFIIGSDLTSSAACTTFVNNLNVQGNATLATVPTLSNHVTNKQYVDEQRLGQTSTGWILANSITGPTAAQFNFETEIPSNWKAGIDVTIQQLANKYNVHWKNVETLIEIQDLRGVGGSDKDSVGLNFYFEDNITTQPSSLLNHYRDSSAAAAITPSTTTSIYPAQDVYGTGRNVPPQQTSNFTYGLSVAPNRQVWSNVFILIRQPLYYNLLEFDEFPSFYAEYAYNSEIPRTLDTPGNLNFTSNAIHDTFDFINCPIIISEPGSPAWNATRPNFLKYITTFNKLIANNVGDSAQAFPGYPTSPKAIVGLGVYGGFTDDSIAFKKILVWHRVWGKKLELNEL